MKNLELLGQTVVVSLYARSGAVLGYLRGRVTDVANDTDVSLPSSDAPMVKDLVLVADVRPCTFDGADIDGVPDDWAYTNSAGVEGDVLAAVSDVRVVSGARPAFPFTN